VENKIITITPKGERWHKTGHPWVYQDDLVSGDAALSGQVVQVKAPNGRLLGQAFYNGGSKIALRWLTDDLQQKVDRAFWIARLKAALDYRQRVVRNSSAYRLIFSEADAIPGLIVDRYDSVLVLQSLSLGVERILPTIVEGLKELVQPMAILAFNDSSVRTLEGLPKERRVLFGKQPERLVVQEGDRRYYVDVAKGQKTGLYLDQRENRLRARDFARGRVLDGFAYQGAFSIQVADKAEEVLAIEDSEWAVQMIKENLELNQIGNVRAERGNAFDRLRTLEQEKQKFDLVILDPPAFAKNKQEVEGAWRGYREINLRAMQVLKPGGTLITCSCSYSITDEIFLEILREASSGARRAVRLIETRTQSLDHPILLTHPESKYLKCLLLEVA